MNIEAWRKNESIDSFDRLTKGAMITIEGYFKPEEWQDSEGVKHNRVVLVANKFYETPDKEETPEPEKKKPRTTKSLDQQGWLRTFLLSNYSHKHAELI